MKHAALAVALGLSFGLAPLASAHHEYGKCYVSKNKSHICYVRTGEQTFAAAVTDGTSPEPTVVWFHCIKGWNGKGSLEPAAMAAVTEAICSDHGLPNTEPLGA